MTPLENFPGIFCNLNIKLPQVSFFVEMSQVLLVNCNIDVSGFSKVNITCSEVLRLDFIRIRAGRKFVFSKMTKLICLSMACTQIGDEGAKALAGVLQYSRRNLNELDLQKMFFAMQELKT